MPSKHLFVLLALLSTLAGTSVAAADIELPPKDNEPVLRIDPGAPSALVTALAFSPDGKTLYAGGWDKVIRVWTLSDKGRFEPSRTPYRVPVGPGLGGAINALALSPDGNWLAAAGNGTARQIAGFRAQGFIVPASGVLDPIALRDVGTIYLFNTRDRTVRMLRGHRGPVVALTFGPPRDGAVPLLLSAAREDKDGKRQLAARLWDADKGESRDELKGLPIEALRDLRPGVALWRSGAGAEDVRAAITLYDGNLRIWEPAKKQPRPRLVEDQPHNLSVAYLPGRDQLLTTGYSPGGRQSQLTRWQIPAEGEPKPDRRNVGVGLVRAVSLLSRKGDGVADLAAVLVISGNRPTQYRLRLVNLVGEEFGRIEADELLWKENELRQPAVATALKGKYLAVAGNLGNDIRVYPVGPLLRKEAVKPQILRGDALTFQHASFVRRGKELGLLLNPQPRKNPGETAPEPDKERGDWIFDFGKRRLTDTLTGWQAARPKAGDWRATRNGARTIAVHDGDKPIREIAISDKEALSDYALLPPVKSDAVPLLVISTHLSGQPRLVIYNAKSAEPLREFTGHKERLRSLAFDPEGRLLVSSAEDGTVCVWSLTDLSTVLNRHGRLPGVVVEQAEGAVAVREVEAGSPALDKLKKGDILAGVVENKKLRRLQSPATFYEALYQMKPGSPVVLRRGAPEGADDVALVVGQGIDERKPLFALFVSRADKAAGSEWIGWSPLGPYESSSPKADKYLGWHFNTGEARTPTRFAGAGQYRKLYYREGVLQRLIERGIPAMGEAIRLPPAEISVWVEEEGQILPGLGRAPILARRPRVDIKVTVSERPLASLSSLTWRLDGGKETPLDLDRPDGTAFGAPVSLSRGEHRFVVTARTLEAPLQPVQESLTVSYVPSPPEVVLKDAGQQVNVRAAGFTFKADIKPKVAGEEVRVTLKHGGKETHTRTFAAGDVHAGATLTFEYRLDLHLGNNVVEVVAVNGGARGDEKESSRQSLEVFHSKAKTPTIRFGRVTPQSERGDGEPLSVDSSRPVVVRLSVVKLDGVIKAGEERLTEAVWDRGKDTRATRLGKFEPDKLAEFAFQELISLKPGIQIVRFRARTKNSDEAERILTLEYRPPVPVASITEPRARAIFDNQEETKTIPVRGKLVFPSKEARGYKAVLLVNGKPASEPPVIAEKAGTLEGTVVVGPGESHLQVKVSNPWGTVGYSEPVSIRYVRPPIVRTLKHKPVPNSALLNLTAEVHSLPPLERQFVRVTVNGHESSASKIQIVRGQKNLWTVQLQGLPLDAGSREQKLVVSVSNVEAECRKPAVLVVESSKVGRPPDVEFLEPAQDSPHSTPRVTIRFRVRSDFNLVRVHLRRRGQADQPIDLPGVPRKGTKSELTVVREVELRPGENVFSVAAVSVSGQRPDSPQLVLTYTPPPLRVEIDRLMEGGIAGLSVQPVGRDGRGFVFPKVKSGRIWLHGHIDWANKEWGRREDFFSLRLHVNGFQQVSENIQRQAGDVESTPFDVPLLLNRAKGNHVSLLVSQQDAGSNAECTVDCGAPITKQRLYVLALSVRSQPDELRVRIRQAINSRRAEKRESATAFADLYDHYPPLTGSRASPHFLCGQLAKLEAEMRRRRTAADIQGAPMNDVVLIYYEGDETINKDGHFFETRSGSGEADPLGMPCDKLVRYLRDIPGAHVLLLDVERSKPAAADLSRDKIESWAKSYPDVLAHVVVMRCARRGAAGGPGAVLLPVLQRTIPQAERLSKLVALVEEVIAASNDAALLVFKSYVPIELADLMFGSPP